MDDITYSNLLKQWINDNLDPSTSAQIGLNTYREQNLVGFLLSNLNIILSDAENRVKQVASTLIYSSYTRISNIEAQIDISPFANKLFEALPAIFPLFPLGEVISNTIIPTYSKIIISNYQATGNVELQQYILNLYSQNQNLEPFLLTIIFEVALGDSNLGGFSIELLLQIVVGELHFAESIIPRFQLYFAIASHALESPELHELFDTLLSSIPDELMHRALYVLDTFIEKTPSFLAPHLDFLFSSLLSMMQNAQVNARWMAMGCFASLVERYPDIFQHSEDLYKPAFNILIWSIAEIPDTIPVDEEDEDEITISTNAKDSFRRICTVAGCSEFFIYYDDLRVITFQDKENLTWQLVYAFLSCIKLFDPLTLSYLAQRSTSSIDDDFTALNDFVQMLLNFVLDPGTHPRIRIAVYDGISKLCKTSLNYFQRATADYIPDTLRQLVFNDPYQICQKKALKTLTKFFNEKVLPNIIITFFPKSYDELLQLITQFSEDFVIYIIRALSSFTKVLDMKNPEHNQKTYALIATLLKQYNITKEPNLKIEIIHCFEHTMQKFFKQIPPKPESLRYCLYFLQESILMYQNNDLMPQEIAPSINGLIMLLEQHVKLILSDFLPFILQESLKDLEIESDTNQATITNYASNLYLKIPSRIYGSKNYVLKQSIRNIESSISILIHLSCAMGVEFNTHIPECMRVLQKWFFNDNHIERLKKICWDLLLKLISKVSNDEDTIMNDLFDFAFTVISQSNNLEGSTLYITKAYQTMHFIIEIAFNNDYYNEELLIQMLNVSSMVLDHLLNQKNEKLESISQFTKEDVIEEENREIAHLDQALDKVCSLITGFMKSYKQLGLPWFRDNMFEKCQQYLYLSHSYVVGSHLLTFFALTANDINLVCSLTDILMEIIRRCTQQTEYKQFYDAAYTVMDFLGNLVSSYVFDPEFCQKTLNFFIEFVGDEGLADNNDLSFIHDVGLVAFSKFLIKNIQNVDEQEAIEEWFNCFPLWDPVLGSNYVYSFLADLLETRNSVFFNDDEMLKNVVERVILHVNKEAMKKKTIIRLLTFIQEMYEDPNYSQLMEAVLSGIEVQRKNQFLDILHDPPTEEEDENEEEEEEDG